MHLQGGAAGADDIGRISGLILAALAVETILQGIRASFSLPLSCIRGFRLQVLGVGMRAEELGAKEG